ncbi:uncharacterized protein [Paramormyrops kingsleyae]|uniref:uncharacterized protein isoform X1 n=1 Tax=Paramormyrops kingsleyae TaxID=1676925 RepID=UPI000CD64328|nr:probable isoprenylcysteine alpha-carbonyl methylesterase ICMEL2 isoform X2 [Paramormyrops kingsleyae]XP_023676420.1 probable isoprenylcysteine alpha-carbonyl methylesterase ICMEL2 isoform X2 [Paramormyrops kingsleyae]XP_023676421.1 probable isoprenylcysteine alpha-carbonyl methylesterase ICMEL2 isoform X2 [Paramormyrops kingsleyae]
MRHFLIFRTVVKCGVSLAAAAGAAFIVVPYSVALLAQWLYGWPGYPGPWKYVEALRPWRIYALTRAVLETVKYLKYGRLYCRWKLWYKNIDNHKYYEKGIVFGSRGERLDLYYSPKTDQSEAAGTRAVVFVYGGAWGSGERATYCLLSLQMARELSAAVICPDYSTFPKGNVSHMVQDITECLLWLKENGQKWNIDTESVFLVGHSAGAHLCALTTLFLAEGSHVLGIQEETQRQMFSSIRGVIGLSGVYDIVDHYEYERTRGVEFVSSMHKAMGGVENFHLYSPRRFLQRLSRDKLERLPPFCLIHGTGDVVVPVESSVRFSEALAALSLKVSLYLLPDVQHADVVTDLMAPEGRCYHTVFGCMKQSCLALAGSPSPAAAP